MDEELTVTLTRPQAIALRDAARVLHKQSWQERDKGEALSLPLRIAGELFWAAQALDEALSQPARME